VFPGCCAPAKRVQMAKVATRPRRIAARFI
jgi:hypothetical protein